MNRKINIVDTISLLPQKVLLSSEMDSKLNYPSGYIEKITGLKERKNFYDFNDMEEHLKIGFKKLLDNNNLKIEDINCIIASSATMFQQIPYNGAYLHKLFNLNHTTSTFDVNMTCLSALRSMEVASGLLNNYKNIIIVTADFPSQSVDWKDFRTAGIFGDGVSFILLNNENKQNILYSNFETHSQAYDYCQIRGGGTKRFNEILEEGYSELCFFEMKGKLLYKLSSEVLLKFINKALIESNLTIEDIKYIVPHQASGASLKHMTKLLKIEEDKMINIFQTHGNQVSSSIPSALNHVIKNKKLEKNDKIMIIGTSAGLGLGIMILEF